MTVQDQISANRWRTLLVLAGFGMLVAALMLAIAGFYDPSFAGFAGIGAIIYGLFAWRRSGQMVAQVAGAHPITRSEHPELWSAVDNASIAAGLARTPDVYIINDPAPNAFAAGRNEQTAYVAATTGLLELLDKRELEGVMAHEIAHVRNHDVQLMTIAAVLTGSIVLLCDMVMRMTLLGGSRRGGGGAIALIGGLVVLILAPLLAGLMQMSLSRRREYLADASAVDIAGDADGLASALAKLTADKQPLKKVTRATAHMYIESPLRDHVGLRSGLGGLFDTHPPMDERIRRLQLMAGGVDPEG